MQSMESKKISVTSLAASSRGNSYYIKSGNTEFLIDAGISAKCICDSLVLIGSNISRIQSIFVTHEHIDHVKGLNVLSKKHDIPIHMTKPSADEYFKKYPDTKNIVTHDINYEYMLNDIKICSFYSSHDSAACVGYTVSNDFEKFGIATDMGYVDKATVDALSSCVSVVLESNYDDAKLTNGCYPEILKNRIRSTTGHLSNYDCAAFARYLAERGTKNFMLGHLSQENNSPEMAFNITSRALKDFVDIVIKVAERNKPTFFI